MVQDEADVLAAEREFFRALMDADGLALEALLEDEFILVDLSGAVSQKSSFVSVISSRLLRFEEIKPVESSVRFYGSVAIVVGRTQMSGRMGDTSFTAHSRYTHIYVQQAGRWKLASAQGTYIV